MTFSQEMAEFVVRRDRGWVGSEFGKINAVECGD